MKRVIYTRWMTFTVALLLWSAFFAGCSSDDEVRHIGRTYPADRTDGAPVPNGSEVLAGMKGVTVIKDTTDADNRSITWFYFDQPVDHNDPSAGTFRQYCALHYVHPDSVTVLHTEGYSTTERKLFQQRDLSKNLGGNFLEVEHRYYRKSRINPDADYNKAEYWKYNTAGQSTADLHAVVTALKASGRFRGKWVSTGISKNGILTGLYAYYYPNDMDVYVPFCAPFCNGSETPGIGRWLTQECGKGTVARDRIWATLKRMATDADLQEDLAARYKAEFPKNMRIQGYNTKQIMYFILYRYMSRVFSKFCYVPFSSWQDVVPSPTSSGELVSLFTNIYVKNYYSQINNLRKLWNLEEVTEENDYESETYDDYDYEDYDDWDGEDGEPAPVCADAPEDEELEKLLKTIYFVHAARELGYFLYDWSPLTEESLITDGMFRWLKNNQTIHRYNRIYGVTYDGGVLMNNFLNFVAENRNRERCRMLFVYGANDPWTGAAIPDPAADDPCVKKYIVPGGIHSDRINDKEEYSRDDRERIVSTVRSWLRD